MCEELCISDIFIDGYKYLYYLVRDIIECEDEVKRKVYGIKIQKLNKENIIDEVIVKDISIDKQKIITFIKSMCDNIVTPITLLDIVQDNI